MITVNGSTLEAWLDKKSGSQIDDFLKNEVVSMVRQKFKHLPIKGIAQEYDVVPGACRIYSREDILMEELKPHYKQKTMDMIAEGELDRPNRNKLAALAMCDEKFLTVTEIREKLNNEANVFTKHNALSSLVATLKKQKKPIMSLVEIGKKRTYNNRNIIAYRIFPPAVKIKSKDLAELCRQKGHGSYTIRDAIREVPELEQFIADKKLSQADKEPKAKPKATKLPKAVKTVKEPSIGRDLQTAAEVKAEKIADEIRQNYKPDKSANELKISVNISIGPIKFLFGLDK